MPFPVVSDLLGGDCARPLGCGNSSPWVPATISTAAPGFFRGQGNACKRPNFKVSARQGGPGATFKRCHSRGTTQRTASWVLFQILYCAQKGRRSAACPRSKAPESVPQGVAIQNGPHRSGDKVNSAGRVVYVSGLKGRLFPCPNLPGTQDIPPVCLPGQGVPVPGPPLRPLTGPKSFQPSGLRRTSPTTGTGVEDTPVPGRLAYLRPLSRAGSARHQYIAGPHPVLGIYSQLEEEQCAAPSTGSVPGDSLRFSQYESVSHWSESGQLDRDPEAFSAGQAGYRQQSPETAGLDGCSSCSGSTRSAEVSALPVLVQCFPTPPKRRQAGQAVCFSSLHLGPASLEEQGVPAQRCPPGGSSTQETGHLDRCIPNRVGGCLGRTFGKGHLATSVDIGAYKCPRIEGHSPRPSAIPASDTAQPRSGEIGQHLSGVSRQSPGGDKVPEMPPGGGGTTNMGMASTCLSKGCAHSGRSKQCSRHALQDGTTPGRVETAHRRCRTDLDALRGCASGSVCVSGNNPLPRVVLSQGAGGQFGPGCSIARVADRLVVRFSSDPSHPSGSAEDQGGPTHSPVGCPTLASETLVCRSAPATAGSAMAIAEQGRPAGTSRWADMASKPGRPAPLGLASTEPVTERLDASVQETLNNARAPSTRASYALRWRIFSDWCQSMDIEPAAACPVPHVLRFLQSQLDQGKAVSTVKVYASAISAFHQGTNNGPLGRHPLVGQFLKGARRLRPARTLRAPGWDLPMVLASLTGAPYEPIADADLRSLSLKTAFLLALCSARRVGELCALSVSDDCLRWREGGTSVSLWPSPAFLPKVVNRQSINQVLEVDAFQPASASQAEQERLLTLCPVRALRAYLTHTQPLRGAHSQLFVCYGVAKRGLPLSKQRLSHWLVDVISHAYKASGMQVPPGLRAHSTRSMATSWAALRGVPADDICAAALWSTPCTFTRFYRVDVTRPASVGNAALMSMTERGF